MIIKIAIIRKENGKYKLYSRKKNPKTGKRRLLGESDTLEGIKKREKQIQFFKFHCEDQNNRDKETKALSLCSDLASFLEQSGYIKSADKIYMAMDSIDEDNAADFIPSNQANIENEGTIGGLGGTGGGSGMFSIMEGERVASKLFNLANRLDVAGLYKEADVIDNILLKFAGKEMSMNNVSSNSEPEITVSYGYNKDNENYNSNKHFKNIKDALNFFNSLGEDMNNEDDIMSAQQLKEIEQNRKLYHVIVSVKRDWKNGYFSDMDFWDCRKMLAQRLKMNPNNRQEGGFIAGLMAAMQFIHPQEAFGDPEAYQSALIAFDNPDILKDDMDNIDALVRSNGLDNNSVIDNQNSGMFQGLSDAYMYSGYGNLEGAYGPNR